MRVELQDVYKSYILAGGGLVTVLNGIDLVMESGSFSAIIGPLACGKTTLLDIIGGLACLTSGSVRLDGNVLKSNSNQPPKGVAFAFQEPYFIPELTVQDNLLLPALCYSDSATVGRGERLLEKFGLAEVFDHCPARLSPGEKQRLNLARAILRFPRLLLLDDPTAGLDDLWSEQVLELIMQEARDMQATLLITAHRPLYGVSGMRQIRMRSGKVSEDDNSDY